MKATDTISSVGEAIEKVTAKIKDVVPEVRSSRPGFGFWFRGQIDVAWDITPSIWLPETNYDEGSMSAHFRLLRPEHEATHKGDFDWLTLMQHHGLPTRLVDWTENLLVGLFFATWREGSPADARKDLEHDGALFLLSARKLNRLMTDRFNIAVPTGFHAVARAVMSLSNNMREWTEEFLQASHSRSSTGAHLFKSVTKPESDHDRNVRHALLSTPVAVFPSRRNERLVAQAGTFTIHGGKRMHETMEPLDDSDGLPPPQTLVKLNDAAAEGDKFLWKFDVKKKVAILAELELLGIHQGTLFPDLAHQAQFIKTRWNTGRT